MKTFFQIAVILILSVLAISCEDEIVAPSNHSEIKVKNSDTYQFNLNISGDEEGAVIIEQASHFEISELKRDASTDWSVIYFYKPESGYSGTDSVRIETNTGSDGASAGILDTIKIVFQVTP